MSMLSVVWVKLSITNVRKTTYFLHYREKHLENCALNCLLLFVHFSAVHWHVVHKQQHHSYHHNLHTDNNTYSISWTKCTHVHRTERRSIEAKCPVYFTYISYIQYIYMYLSIRREMELWVLVAAHTSTTLGCFSSLFRPTSPNNRQ